MPALALTEERPVAEMIVEALAQGGVRFVVGMPGGLTGPLWRALHDHPTIRAVQVREESIGSYMAEAHGRMTGEPVVVMGQGEWIAGNAGQGYLEALLGSSPMLVLTEMSDGASLSHHAPYQSGTGDYGTWDARTAMAGFTKRVMVSYDPVQAVQHTQLALKHAITGEPGPVAVIYHSRALDGVVGPASVPRIFHTSAYLPPKPRSLDAGAIDAAVGSLRAAARPVIIAGNGVRLSAAQQTLAHLADIIDAPVATTASGKGVFPETHPLSVGVIGTYGWASANTAVAESDVVLAVGTKLSPSDTMIDRSALLDPSRQTLIQIDIEPLNAAWTFPVDHTLIGDAGVVMGRIAEVYQIDSTTSRQSGGRDRASALHPRPDQLAAPPATDQVPLLPRQIVSVIQEYFRDDGVITCDAGENRLFMMQWFRCTSGGEYLQPAAGGGMGYAVPAAMGAKLARPERPVLAVCGDGGFAMSIHALMTAVQEELPVGVLVFNNGALGWVLHGMGERAVAARFAQFDHAAIARSLGCDGVRIASVDELRDALKRIPALSGPLVIDVPTSLATSFQDVAQHYPKP